MKQRTLDALASFFFVVLGIWLMILVVALMLVLARCL